MYQHHNWQGALLDYPVSKWSALTPSSLDIQRWAARRQKSRCCSSNRKPALCDIRQPLALPQGLGAVHHEVELAVLIGATLRQAPEAHVQKTRLPVMAWRWI